MDRSLPPERGDYPIALADMRLMLLAGGRRRK
jgi:hypothetical protein